MRRITLALAAAASIAALPALARQSDAPMADNDPDAMDVAKTPVTDLNIDKQEIPELLISAQREPYTLTGLRTCRPLIDAVEELDDLLGPDIDLPQAERDRISAGRVAKKVVGSFIPFRGLIREVSGAEDHQKKVRAAIQAGIARRGFLKGVGLARSCKYPGRPATREIVAQRLAELRAAEQAKDEKKARNGKNEGKYVSQPVIQKTNR